MQLNPYLYNKVYNGKIQYFFLYIVKPPKVDILTLGGFLIIIQIVEYYFIFSSYALFIFTLCLNSHIFKYPNSLHHEHDLQ